jgi:hypothetical protein
MPNLTLIDGPVLQQLRAVGGPPCAQIVQIRWPKPYQPKSYGFVGVDRWYPDLPFPFENFEVKLIPENIKTPALTIPRTASISDDVVNIEMGNTDGEMVELLRNGEGARVEIFDFFPTLNLVVNRFLGHVQAPDEVTTRSVRFPIASGFRSALASLPSRRFLQSCEAIYGALIGSLELVAKNPCPYNRHLPGGTIGLLGPDGAYLPSCNRHNLAECAAHLGADLAKKRYLGFLSADGTQFVPSKAGGYLATSKGNETNLQNPLRVVYGEVVLRALDLLTFQVQLNSNHPETGTVSFIFATSEGPVADQSEIEANNAVVAEEHLKKASGEIGQDAILLTDKLFAANYSGTALFRGLQFGNFAIFDPSSLQGKAKIKGRSTVQVLSSPTDISEEYTTNTSWCFRELLTNNRFGHKWDPARYLEQDWIDLAGWSDNMVATRDSAGNVIKTKRSTFNCDVYGGRNARLVVRDICASHRICPPFDFGGFSRVKPLDRVDVNGPIDVFTDIGEDRNIVGPKNGESSLKLSWKGAETIPARVILTYLDPDIGYKNRAMAFTDQKAMLARGRAYGDNTADDGDLTYTAFGLTDFGQAIRLGWTLLHLGPLDEGGLRNNLTANLTVFGQTPEGLNLHPYKVIKIVSPKLINPTFVETTGRPFEYFRVMKMTHRPDFNIDLICQVYPVDYYDALEADEPPDFMFGAGMVAQPATVQIVG